LGVALLGFVNKGVSDASSYKDAITKARPEQKRYVYRNEYLLTRLADTLDIPSFVKCVELLGPDQRGRLIAAKLRVKKRFGLEAITEEGAAWTEDELAFIEGAFLKMAPGEQELLHGVSLVRKKEIRSEVRHGKKFSIDAETSGGNRIELTADAFKTPITPLHEAGHLIQQKLPIVARQALEGSKTRTNMNSAAQAYKAAAAVASAEKGASPEFVNSLNQMVAAITNLIHNPAQEQKDALDFARNEAEVNRQKEHLSAWLEAHDRLKAYADAVEQFTDEKQAIQSEPGKIEAAFVKIVKDNHLAQSSFAPFNDYVAHSWPEKPQEFLVQCYATWRKDPDYLRRNAPKLFEWFENGGHLSSKKSKK
jgi:hypothetical protein